MCPAHSVNSGYGNNTLKVGFQKYCCLFSWLLPSVDNLFVLSQKLIRGAEDSGSEQPEQDAGVEDWRKQADAAGHPGVFGITRIETHYIFPGKLSSMGTSRHVVSIQHRGRINEYQGIQTLV